MPEWSRKCPLGVPLIVCILTLAGPGPFLHVRRGGSDFRDLMFILSYYLLVGVVAVMTDGIRGCGSNDKK